MTHKSILALVVSSPGDLQNGLLALMTTIPPINAVLVAEDIKSALRMVENHQPTIIILELSSCQVLATINEIKTQWPRIHLIVLVNDIIQSKDAEASGADSVLIKGFSAQKLIAIVEDLLEQRENSHRVLTNIDGGSNIDQ